MLAAGRNVNHLYMISIRKEITFVYDSIYGDV